jgi:hypothetical protein
MLKAKIPLFTNDNLVSNYDADNKYVFSFFHNFSTESFG